MAAPKCPECGTPLEWSQKERRFLHCHKSPEAIAIVRDAGRKRRARTIYLREYKRKRRAEAKQEAGR